jgi:hypothetical protein
MRGKLNARRLHCRYETFNVSDADWTCNCQGCIHLNHGCRYSDCKACGLIASDENSDCACKWTCRCQECVNDRGNIEYKQNLKRKNTELTMRTVDEQAHLYEQRYDILDKSINYEKMIWDKNNIIAELRIKADVMWNTEKKHKMELITTCLMVADKTTEILLVNDLLRKNHVESDKKIKDREWHLADCNLEIKCKNQEIDFLHNQINGNLGSD